MAERETRPRSQLALEAFRHGDGQAGPKELPLQWREGPLFGAGQVVPGRAGGGSGGQRQPLSEGQPGDQNLDQRTAPTSVRGSWNASATPG